MTMPLGPDRNHKRCRCRRYSRWDRAQGCLLVLMIPALALGFVLILVRIFASTGP